MTISIFDFDDYKKFVLAKLKEPVGGKKRTMKAMAEKIRLSQASLSLVFHGTRDLSSEQALEVAEHLRLKALEAEYFFALAENSRAGSSKLKEFSARRVRKVKKQADKLKNRISVERELGSIEKITFYSEWYYIGIMLCVSQNKVHKADSIAKYLNLDMGLVGKCLEFLVSCGLCVEQNGQILIGPKSIHLGSDDPIVFRHHQNWRMAAHRIFCRKEKLAVDEYAVSIPFCASGETIKEIKKLLLKASESAIGKIDTSEFEELAFLNIDLLRF